MRGQEVNCTPGISLAAMPGVQAEVTRAALASACRDVNPRFCDDVSPYPDAALLQGHRGLAPADVLAARLCGKCTATVAVADPPFAERPRPARWVTVPSQTLRPRPCASLGCA